MTSFEIWNRYMQSYDFLTAVDGYNRNLRDIEDAIGPTPGMRILDAGSGTGNLSIALKSAGANVDSCDFSPTAISAHLKKDPSARVVNASLENSLPYESDSFHAIGCASVLFALSPNGCRNALSEFYRVLRSNGQITITVPAREARLRSLVKMHIVTLLKRHGIVHGGVRAVKDIPALTNVLRYNRLLMNLPDWQGFHIFTEAEIRGSLIDAGFSEISIQRTYGDCFLLVRAVK